MTDEEAKFKEALSKLNQEWREFVGLVIAPPIVALENEIRKNGLALLIVRIAGAGLLAFVVYGIAS